MFLSQDCSEVKSYLKDNDINLIIMNIARILIEPELLIAAYQLNIPVKIIYHSNKEINAQNRISYPYDSFAVWNDSMKNDLVPQISSIDSCKIDIVGNTHFTSLNNPDNIMKKDEFEKKFNLNLNDMVILYTAAGVIVKNECLIVEYISKLLEKRGKKFKIIVRQNPMDTTNSWQEYFENNTNVFIQKPKWYMNNKVGLNYTLSDDLIEYTSLLSYSDLCINIPSTVTLECAIKKLPVLNICFDFDGVEVSTNDGKILTFWDAPFYKDFHKYDFINPVFNLDELDSKVLGLCSKKAKKDFSDYDNCKKDILSFDLNEIRQKTKRFILKTKNGG